MDFEIALLYPRGSINTMITNRPVVTQPAPQLNVNGRQCVHAELVEAHEGYVLHNRCTNMTTHKDPHGWLCGKHMVMSVLAPVTPRNHDQEVAEGVILTDRRAIAKATLQKVRLVTSEGSYLVTEA